MKKTFWFTLFLLCFNSVVHARTEVQKWYATLELNGEKLPLILELEDKGKHVKLFSPRQSNKGFEVQNWHCDNTSMSWQVKSLQIDYKGEWLKDSAYYIGQFVQGGMKIPLKWSSTERKISSPVYVRPQTPKPPFDYIEKELSFNSKEGDHVIELSGTLVMPKGEGPFPCLIMISGSGPQNRNEEIMGHQPFAIIADDLAKKGWATFRYDDRGVGNSKGNFSMATTFDFVIDANAAWMALQKEKNLIPGKIGLLGHSEGGLVAPMVAAQNPGIYCIVSLAGPGVTGAEIMCTQTVDIDRAEGMKEPEIAKSLQTNKDIIALISSDADSVKVAKQIKKYVYKENSNLKKDMREAMFMSYNNAMNSAWMKTFVKVDPISYWQKVQCPTLILNGDKDWQVRWDVNAHKIAEVLLKNQVPFEKVILAEHNHLFQYSESGKVSEYAKIEESISPETLQTIREWLIKLP